jgi:predicted PilT family ATPase
MDKILCNRCKHEFVSIKTVKQHKKICKIRQNSNKNMVLKIISDQDKFMMSVHVNSTTKDLKLKIKNDLKIANIEIFVDQYKLLDDINLCLLKRKRVYNKIFRFKN